MSGFKDGTQQKLDVNIQLCSSRGNKAL